MLNPTYNSKFDSVIEDRLFNSIYEKQGNTNMISVATDQKFVKEHEAFISRPIWQSFAKTVESFQQFAPTTLKKFDPRFNAILWAHDVIALCREIVFSFCYMNASAIIYKEKVESGSQPSHTDFFVSYFADNCITRIDSCRDKNALMIWAFYCPFNPEERKEVLDFQLVLERLKYPTKFALGIKDANIFISHLETLRGTDFRRLEKYRNLKIHRREPRIEIYGVAQHHGWQYMLPLLKEDEIAAWQQKLEQQYPDATSRALVKKGGEVNGILFDRRNLKDAIWKYDEIKTHVESALMKMLVAGDNCIQALIAKLQ